MSDSDTLRKWFYPTEEQWERWKVEMEERGFNTPNQFVQAMVETGLKEFNRPVQPDETVQELREHRNDLKDALDRARERIERLEEQLYNTDHAAAARYLADNPDADYSEVLEHVRATAPERVTRFLEAREATGEHPETVVAGAIDELVEDTKVSMTDKARDEVVDHLEEKADEEGEER